MRPSVVFILIVFIFSLPGGSTLINRTIDDSDLDRIRYVPSTNWKRESEYSTCPECLRPDPNLTLRQTVHYGLHATLPNTNKGRFARKDHNSDGGSDHDDPNDSEPRKSANARTTNVAAFQDVTVMASLNFTGSAFYVYCVLPPQHNNTSILSTTNLTFLLDGLRVGSFIHDSHEDSGSRTDFIYQVPVFFMNNLPHARHTLDIKAEPGSGVLLDYIEYSTLDINGSTSSAMASAPSKIFFQSNRDEGEGDDKSSKKNKVTFGVAIGCTVGVLTLVALGVCISLYRRRRRSAQLQRRFDTEDAPHVSSRVMHGPEPFIPRYFPGTLVLPSDRPLSPSASVRSYDAVEELGPSHGLEFPPAPEHSEEPEYTTPYMSSGRTTPATLVPRVSSSSALMDADDVLPRYQDAERTLFVSIPITYPPPPPPPPPSLAFPYSMATPHPAPVEHSTSTSNLHISSQHSDLDHSHAPAPFTDEPPIHTGNDDRPL